MNQKMVIRLSVAALTSATLACNLSAPLRPTPPAVSGDSSSGATLKVTAPSPQSPSDGVTLTDAILSGLTLSAGTATAEYGSAGALQYEFELMNGGGNLVERSGARNSPTWTQAASLDSNATYQWRVRAIQDGHAGPWSTTTSFRTSDVPDHFKCGPPFNTSPEGIIQCHRDLFDSNIHDEELPVMLKRVARDFNRAGIAGGPFGVLWKLSGNNCHGYSCDVICSGQGDDQNQWDILIDESIANWGGDIDGIRADFCEIQPSALVDVFLEQPVR
jgi:hypothetical protein